MGQAQHGIYDAADDADPELLHLYYGTPAGDAGHHPSTSAGAEPLPSGSGSESPSSSGSPSSSLGSDSEAGSSNNAESSGDGDSNEGDSDSEKGDSDSDESGSGSNEGNGPDPDADGGPMDESETGRVGSWQDIAGVIATAQGRNVRHEAAEVARSAMPFTNASEGRVFASSLKRALSSKAYPAGFHLNDEYESKESYTTGRSSKPLVIPLPHNVWFPRILAWCTAIDILMRLESSREHAL